MIEKKNLKTLKKKLILKKMYLILKNYLKKIMKLLNL